MTRLMAVTAALMVLLLGSCASEPEPGADDGNTATAESGQSDSKDEKKDRKKKQRGPGGDSREKASEDGDRSPGAGGKDRTEGGSPKERSGNPSNGETSPYPAAGTYTFSQSGYEEFCDSAGRCEKEDLPARQPVEVSFDERSESSAVIVTDQEASGSRRARTWTRFTPEGAHITKVYIEFEYSGFRFERTYVPQPPVEAMRFPLTAGEKWSGQWKASTSGSYTVEIGRPRRLQIGGKTVTAYPVDTVTEFRGDFEGKSRLVAYIDEETKSIVATNGALNVTSQFGRYSTVFDTKLASGPGY